MFTRSAESVESVAILVLANIPSDSIVDACLERDTELVSVQTELLVI